MPPHPAIARTAAAGLAATAAATLAFVGAPQAVAGPAPQFVESSYLVGLYGNNQPNAEAQQLALKLGYLVCALDLTGGAQPAGAAVYLNVAQSHGLCSYVSVAGQPSQAQLREEFGRRAKQSLDLGLKQNDQAINERILQDPPDIDGDGIPNAVDSQPRYYNP